MQLTLQQQPEHSKLCGQTCVAMLLNKPLIKVVKENFQGHNSGTTYKHLIAALKNSNIHIFPAQRIKKGIDFPDISIVRLHFKEFKNHSHYVIVLKNYDDRLYYIKHFIYDPVGLIYTNFIDGSYPTSFMEVKYE
jgi:hypothetical protein